MPLVQIASQKNTIVSSVLAKRTQCVLTAPAGFPKTGVHFSSPCSRAAAKPRRSVRRADRHFRARAFSRQSRRSLSPRRPDIGTAPLGLAAMDLLGAELQGPPSPGLARSLHRIVLPR